MQRRARRSISSAFLLTAGILLCPISAFADDVSAAPATPAVTDPTSTEPDWDVKLIGYGWLASIYADVSAGPVDTTLDVRIGDLIRKITWVVMAGFEVRYQEVLFQMDGLGMQAHDSVGGSQHTETFTPLGGVLGGGVAVVGPADVSLRSTTVMGEGALGYRALSLPLSRLFSSVPDDDSRRFRLDLLGGARYWYFRTEVRLSIPPARITVGGISAPPALFPRIREKFGRTRVPRSLFIGGSNDVFTTVTSWTDAIVGFRVGMDVSKTVSLAFRSDVGGFGFGDSSKISWQVLPSIEWRFADNWSFDGAYRVIGVDRNNVSNGLLYGFVLGIGYRF